MNPPEQPKFLRFVNRLEQVMTDRHMRQIDLCEKAGINRPILNHYLSHKIDRPAPKFLKAICRAFQFGPDAVELVSEHLRDELERAGFRPKDFTIYHQGLQTSLSPRIIALAEAAARSPGWSATIRNLANMAKADSLRGYPAGAEVAEAFPSVAEAEQGDVKFAMDKPSPASYDPPKKKRKRKGPSK